MRTICLALALGFIAVPAVRGDSVADAEKAILDLYDSGKLFQRPDYKSVRAAFASAFEAKHEATIRTAFGEDYDALTKWFETRADLKENFYTAIEEQHDDVPRALGLFREIWKAYPDKLDKWGNLAIAVAVVWDRPQRGVYDYKGHQVRTKSVMPTKLIDALDNFKYLVDAEKKLVHQTHLYPWEFLTFVVDHRTPLAEREWSFGYYQKAKGSVKSWHQDVPYDMDMLKSEKTKGSKLKPKLADKDYTLANILQYGGVCAQQADFAARTAKSLGVPAMYCSGESAYRSRHAWWMHVHVTSASKEEIKFSLVSDGRYEGFERDQFYTGVVLDPHTGTGILDRDMERRLWIAGNDRVGKRLTHLLARGFPIVIQKRSLDVTGKVAYLDKMIKINRHDDFAWRALATMAVRGELTADQKKVAVEHLHTMHATFTKYPDVIARLLEPMLGVVPAASEKTRLYGETIQLFEKSKRPDLACDARLKLTEILIEDKKTEAAGQGLLAAIRKFPTEGRYLPKLTVKLEELAPQFKGGVQQTGKLYVELLPAMILHYRNPQDSYCVAIEQQAKAFLSANNQTATLTQLEAALAAARSQFKGKAK